MKRFEGRKVLVTGGSSGIGSACVKAFVAEGASVAAVGRDAGRLETVRSATLAPERVFTLIADLSEPGEAKRATAEAIGSLSGLDVLLNNAGVAFEEPAVETTEETWRTTMATNLDAAFFASQVAGKHMIDQGGGVIVNVASIDGIVPEGTLAAYNASKAALISLTRTMAVELGPHGIRINAVAPGETLTAMTEADITNERFRREYLRQVPLGRFGSAEEQARVILFLASDEASYVNGATLVADGGQIAGTWYYPWQAPEPQA
jgi:3-oxoacyl-[acyl-carrier protein] reductase